MSAARRTRLPNDVAGLLEDRITDEPLDFPAYEELIRYYRSKSNVDEVRQVYERLLKVLPSSAYLWRQYAEMEASENELNRVEAIFNRALMTSLHLDIWNYYLDYIRRTHPLSTGGPSARSVISQAYEFVLQHVGIDLESGPVWTDYLIFLKSAPATSSWEEQQRNDQLRKVYQRAVVTPLNNVESIWKEYNAFENGINRQTARKFLNEKSPAYMTARATMKELSPILHTIRAQKLPLRTTRGSTEEQTYLAGWKKWISIEKGDPLELEDQTQLRNRVKYAYKQALMLCRFIPEMWYDAAIYFESLSEMETVQESTHTKPSVTLKEGLTANPSSWLLSFAYAEIEEVAQRNENVKATFDTLLSDNEAEIRETEAKYSDLIAGATKEVTKDAPKVKQNQSDSDSDSESDSETEAADAMAPDIHTNGKVPKPMLAQIKKFEDERDAKIKELSEEGTVAAIMYMRALRRMEGIKAARLSFANSIRSPHTSWQIYVASALMEHQHDDARPTEKDGKVGVPIPVRIFTRGLKIFPENVDYILAYLSFLLEIRDDKNARALFEQTTAKMDSVKARPLFARWYQYESMFGDLTSAQKLASRIVEADNATKPLTVFGQRFSYLGCNPIARRDIGITTLVPMPGMIPPPPFPQLPPPHPLAFPPPPPPPSAGQDVPFAGAPGFNPPLLPEYQRNASPLPPAQVLPAPAAPLHFRLMNLLRDLPPASAMQSSITFKVPEFLQLIRDLDLTSVDAPLVTSSPAQTYSRQATPQVTQPPVVPLKRSAQSMIPTPDDVIALGRHNDPKDPYKKRS